MKAEERAERAVQVFNSDNGWKKWGSPRLVDLITQAIRDAEDAAYERAADKAHEIAQFHAKGWYENPKADGCGGGIAASNTGTFIAKSIRSLKSNPGKEG